MCLPLRRTGLRLLLLWALSLGVMAQSSTLNFTNATALDYDPVRLMCARWEHQSTLELMSSDYLKRTLLTTKMQPF